MLYCCSVNSICFVCDINSFIFHLLYNLLFYMQMVTKALLLRLLLHSADKTNRKQSILFLLHNKFCRKE